MTQWSYSLTDRRTDGRTGARYNRICVQPKATALMKMVEIEISTNLNLLPVPSKEKEYSWILFINLKLSCTRM